MKLSGIIFITISLIIFGLNNQQNHNRKNDNEKHSKTYPYMLNYFPIFISNLFEQKYNEFTYFYDSFILLSEKANNYFFNPMGQNKSKITIYEDHKAIRQLQVYNSTITYK